MWLKNLKFTKPIYQNYLNLPKYFKRAHFYTNLYFRCETCCHITFHRAVRVTTLGALLWNKSNAIYFLNVLSFHRPFGSLSQFSHLEKQWHAKFQPFLQSFPLSNSRNSPRLNVYRMEELSDTYPLPSGSNLHTHTPPPQNNLFLGVQTPSSKENPRRNNIFHLVLKPQENFNITWFHLETINLPRLTPTFRTFLGQTEAFHRFFTPTSYDPHQQHRWVFQKEKTDLKIPAFEDSSSLNLSLYLNCFYSSFLPVTG